MPAFDEQERARILAWAKTNYPQFKRLFTPDNGTFLLLDTQKEDDDHYVVYLNKTYQKDTDQLIYCCKVLDILWMSALADNLDKFLNKVTQAVVQYCHYILPAPCGLNPKTRAFNDYLVNDAREG